MQPVYSFVDSSNKDCWLIRSRFWIDWLHLYFWMFINLNKTWINNYMLIYPILHGALNFIFILWIIGLNLNLIFWMTMTMNIYNKKETRVYSIHISEPFSWIFHTMSLSWSYYGKLSCKYYNEDKVSSMLSYNKK